jgi:hypothetical protein
MTTKKPKLRLLLFEECQRDCPLCCNKYFNLDLLPTCSDYSGYQEIMLTGGEPLLHPEIIARAMEMIRGQTDSPVYLYTSKIDDVGEVVSALGLMDGITVTIHNQNDAGLFKTLDDGIPITPVKSLRANVFPGAMVNERDFPRWKFKEKRWRQPDEFPQDEDFFRLESRTPTNSEETT